MTQQRTAGRGRPRTQPQGLSPSDRTDQWQQDLKRSGGHRLGVNLNASAWHALQKLAPKRGRGPFLERLILAEARKQAVAAE